MSDLSKLAETSVLGIFAHPDDEGFISGGTLALLVARSARVTLVCATNGDVGEISDPSLAKPETLGQVRQEELRQAMAITGVTDLRFLGYRDSGMAGTPANNHPASLSQADPEEVVSRLVAITREVRPQLLISHDPTGVYGHPDHLAIHRYATKAFRLAGRTTAYPEQFTKQLHPWSASWLYYACAPQTPFRRMWQEMTDAGIRPPFADREVNSLGCPDDAVTTTLDVSEFVEIKIRSLNCHRTQMGPNGPLAKLPPQKLQELMSKEYFTLVASGRSDVLASLAARGS